MNTDGHYEGGRYVSPFTRHAKPMSTQLATSNAPVVAVKGDEIEVSAATPNEMAQSQVALIMWCERKIALMRAEAKELRDSYKIALERKWAHSTLKRHADLADKRVTFYEKMLTALQHGYIIVPSFPVEVFAMRSTRDKPLRLAAFAGKWDSSTKEQHATARPAGEGEYKNPFPTIFYRDYSKDMLTQEQIAAGNVKREYYAEAWKDMEFPMNMAKPNIMEATDRAMALKLFDDLGVLPGTRRNVDPIIVGRLLDPRSTKYNRRFVSFIIAWHLDTATL